jgi:hypothetical protein
MIAALACDLRHRPRSIDDPISVFNTLGRFCDSLDKASATL